VIERLRFRNQAAFTFFNRQSDLKDTTPKTHWQISADHYNKWGKHRIRFILHSLSCCLQLAFLARRWYHFTTTAYHATRTAKE